MIIHRSKLFGLLLAAILVGGCEDTVVPGPAVTVHIVPQAIGLDSGRTDTLVAMVRNAANNAVTWASSDREIATVNASGVITAISPGEAVVIATAVEDPDATDSAGVAVRRPAEAIIDDYPVIAIRTVTAAGSRTPVQKDNVANSIDVTIDWETSPWAASSLELRVDQTVVATESLPLTGARYSRTITFTINTAETDASGILRFASAVHVVSVRLIGQNGLVTATSNVSLTFNNRAESN